MLTRCSVVQGEGHGKIKLKIRYMSLEQIYAQPRAATVVRCIHQRAGTSTLAIQAAFAAVCGHLCASGLVFFMHVFFMHVFFSKLAQLQVFQQLLAGPKAAASVQQFVCHQIMVNLVTLLFSSASLQLKALHWQVCY